MTGSTQHPDDWCSIKGVKVHNADGWNFKQTVAAGVLEPADWDTHITENEFDLRASLSTCTYPALTRADKPAEKPEDVISDVPPMGVWPEELQDLCCLLNGLLFQQMKDRQLREHLELITSFMFKAYSKGYVKGHWDGEVDENEYPQWLKKHKTTIPAADKTHTALDNSVMMHFYFVHVPTYVGDYVVMYDPRSADRKFLDGSEYNYSREGGVLSIMSRVDLSGWVVELS